MPSFSLLGFVGLLWRQRRVFVAVLVCVVLVGVVGIFALRPVYTASTLVLVDPSSKDLLSPGGARGDLSDSSRVDSEVLIARSGNVLEGVVDRLALANLVEFERQPGLLEGLQLRLGLRDEVTPTDTERRDAALGILSNSVFVQRLGMTFVLTINAQSPNPQLAADLANAVAQGYIDEQVRRKVATITAGRDAVEARILEAQTATEAAEQALDAFTSAQVEAIAADTGDSSGAIREQLNGITGAIDSQSGLADRLGDAIGSENWSGLASDIGAQTYRDLERQRQAVQSELVRPGNTSGQVLDLRDQLEDIEGDLLAEARGELSAINQAIAAGQATAANLRDQLRANIVNADLPATVLTQIFRLQQEAQIARTQYQELLSRLNDLDTQAYLQVADSSIVGEAGVPAVPSFPNTRLFLLVVLLLALGLATTAAVLVETVVGGFTSPGQLEAVLRADALPSVPRQKGKRRSVADAVLEAPLSPFTEAIRRLRLGVERVSNTPDRPEGAAVVMVTSAVPGEGKTSLSLALARSFAVTGQKCLLIDCDLRKPSLHTQLGLETNQGLMELLSDPDRASINSVLRRDEASGVYVLLGSERSSVATDHLVKGNAFAKLIGAARNVFDVVILDTPPIVPAVDSLYLAGFADTLVFVTKWGATAQADARSAITALRNEKKPQTPILAIINQAKGRAGNKPYYGYESND
jgi:polysaccharide biosynthesis transport protein